MKLIWSVVSALAFSCSAFAQLSSVVPPPTTIARASVADIDHWSAFQNPALLGNINQLETTILYERRFMMSQLSTKSIQLALPNAYLNTGISFSHFGYSLYHEMLLGLSFGRNFSNKFSIGLEFNAYAVYTLASHSYRFKLLPSLGFCYQLTPAFAMAFSSFNFTQQSLVTLSATEKIPSVFSIGTSWKLSPEVVLLTQFDKVLAGNYRYATGIEYKMLSSVKVKAGMYHSGYLIPCLGTTIKILDVTVDFNCELHPMIGLSPIVALNYRL